MSETWVWNVSIDLSESHDFRNISFTSNNVQYTTITIAASPRNIVYYDSTRAFDDHWWVDDVYRTVEFSTAPSGDLLTYLQANATKQSTGGVLA